MIEFRKVSRSFGAIQALKEVSFQIKKGAITIFAGADGAGKSTIFKIMLGLYRKDCGEIFLKQVPLKKDFSALTSICGYMPERFALYFDLTVDENLNFFADIYQIPRQHREELKTKLLEKTGLADFKKRKAYALSGGMKQKLALSSILLSQPELIILDEPTTGVDPLSRIEFFKIITELKNEGKTIIISTPYLDEAEKGDEIIFLKNGRVLLQDSIFNLKDRFSATVYSIIPAGHPLAILQDLKRTSFPLQDIYIKANQLKFITTANNDWLNRIPARQVRKEQPTLEDIYLYYQRQLEKKSD